MKNINLFGASCLTGRYLKKFSIEKKYNLNSYSKSNKKDLYLNLKDYKSFFIRNFDKRKQIWISFTPIWLFSEFLEDIAKYKPNYLEKISILIITSSSSAETKRYSFNNYDKNLINKLVIAEQKILKLSKDYNFKVCILRPTLIYGKLNKISDKNISRILLLMRNFPFILFPNDSGLRQPIHAKQLAKLCLYIAEKNDELENKFSDRLIITVGGDEIFSFYQMLLSLKKKLNKNDKARRCKIIKVNKIVFIFLIYPIAILSPKIYESLLRISSNLAGFDSVSNLMGTKYKKKFPLNPYT